MKTIEITVRKGVEADRAMLTRFIVNAFADVTVLRWREERHGVIGGRRWEEWEANLMRTVDVDRVIVAEVDGQAAGFAVYELNDATRIGTVSDNAVLPEYRNRGVGAQLLAHVLDLMEAAGMELAKVSTGLEDAYGPARRMYERQGFEAIYQSVFYMKQNA